LRGKESKYALPAGFLTAQSRRELLKIRLEYPEEKSLTFQRFPKMFHSKLSRAIVYRPATFIIRQFTGDWCFALREGDAPQAPPLAKHLTADHQIMLKGMCHQA